MTSGLHCGARLALQQRSYRIGSSLEADIVLRDSGVASEHMVLTLERGRIRLEAIGGDVGIANGSLAIGHGCHARMPLDFAVGEAKLRVAAGEPSPAADHSEWVKLVRALPVRWPVAMVCGVVAAVAIAGIADAWSSTARHPRSVAVTQQPINLAALGDISKLRLGPPITPETEPIPPIEEVTRNLVQHLEAAGLSKLQVVASGDRPIVTGALSKHDEAAWMSIQQWFDRAYGRQFSLGANVTETDSRSVPIARPQAVWLGDHRYIVASDGSRYYEGSVLNTGWVVVEIGEERALLAKDGETTSLRYR